MGGNVFFRTTSLQTITIPSTVETIDFTPIVGCTAVKEIKVADGNTHFAEIDSCLYEIDAQGSPVKLVAVPSARDNKVLRVPDGVTALGSQAVREVPMTEIYLPASLLTITENTFSGSTSINKVTCMAKNPPESGFFPDEVYAAATLYVPQASLEKYQADEYWSKFEHIEGIDTGDEPGLDLGDLNGDGNVDVTDVSILIDVVLGKDAPLADGAVTDLNNDGNVDVSDVSLLIDIILGN